jgi:hypothetical protein
VHARAVADRAVLGGWAGAPDSLDQAQQAVAIARELGDPAVFARALTACGVIASFSYDAGVARPYFAEAISLARTIGDRWRLSQILGGQALAAVVAGDPIAVRAVAEEGRDFAEAIGDRFASGQCRWCLGHVQMMQGAPSQHSTSCWPRARRHTTQPKARPACRAWPTRLPTRVR